MRLRLVVDRKAVLRHHAEPAQVRTTLSRARCGNMRMRAIGHHGADRHAFSARSSSSSSLLSPIITVPSSVWRIVVSGCGRNGMVRSVTTIWPRVGPHRRVQADHRRKRAGWHCRRRARSWRRASSPCGVVRRNSPPLVRSPRPAAPGNSRCRTAEAGVEGAKGAQRIDVAVERAIAAAGRLRGRSAAATSSLRTAEASRSCSRPRPSGCACASTSSARCAEFVLAERQVKAAGLLKRDVEAGLFLQLGGEPAPGVRTPARSSRYRRACRGPCPAPRPAQSCRARRDKRRRPRRARRRAGRAGRGPRRWRSRPGRRR